MNRIERETGEGAAILEYLDGEFRVVRPGSHVFCAVSGRKIPLEALRYWSVDLQEAYTGPELALRRLQEKGLVPCEPSKEQKS